VNAGFILAAFKKWELGPNETRTAYNRDSLSIISPHFFVLKNYLVQIKNHFGLSYDKNLGDISNFISRASMTDPCLDSTTRKQAAMIHKPEILPVIGC